MRSRTKQRRKDSQRWPRGLVTKSTAFPTMSYGISTPPRSPAMHNQPHCSMLPGPPPTTTTDHPLDQGEGRGDCPPVAARIAHRCMTKSTHDITTYHQTCLFVFATEPAFWEGETGRCSHFYYFCIFDVTPFEHFSPPSQATILHSYPPPPSLFHRTEKRFEVQWSDEVKSFCFAGVGG